MAGVAAVVGSSGQAALEEEGVVGSLAACKLVSHSFGSAAGALEEEEGVHILLGRSADGSCSSAGAG